MKIASIKLNFCLTVLAITTLLSLSLCVHYACSPPGAATRYINAQWLALLEAPPSLPTESAAQPSPPSQSLAAASTVKSQSSPSPPSPLEASAPPKNVWTPVQSIWRLLDKNATLSLPLPRFGNYQCRDQICSEFLTDEDKNDLLRCEKHPSPKLVPRCHFMNGTHRSPVALISYPGSGNTWVRGLLEKATGICTGESSDTDIYM